jgi:site-specific DNA-methyltransferase (adenine-specific)
MLELNKIYCADCLELMQEIPDKSIDLLLTDPPYGIKRDKGFEGFGGFGGFGTPIARRRYEEDDWDSERPTKEIFNGIIRISKNAIIFGGNFFTDLLPQSNHWLVWDKLNTMPTFGDCELAWTNFPRNSVKKYELQYNGLLGKESERFHPTQKPLKLMEWCLKNYSKEGDLVLDPFLGSGTTAVACKRLGRNFIGIEKEQKYVEIALKRLEKVNNHKITEWF